MPEVAAVASRSRSGVPAQNVVRRKSAARSARSTVRSTARLGVSQSISESIEALRQTGGAPLPGAVQKDFEERLGQDFSQVRVHTGDRPATTARQLKAKAFTVGNDVVFGKGQFRPETASGKRLIAHELTHVGQQSNAFSRKIRREKLIDAPELELVPQDSVQPGIDLPKVDANSPSVDVRSSADYVESNVSKLGFGIYEPGYHLWIGQDERHLTIPWNDVDLLSDKYFIADNTVYETESAARNVLRNRPYGVAFYRGRYGLKYPTKFCKASTPAFVQLALKAQADYRRAVQQELASLAAGMVLGKILGYAYSKAQSAFRGPVPRRSFQNETAAPESRTEKVEPAKPKETNVKAKATATPRIQLPNGEWALPDSFSGGFHGTNIPANEAPLIRTRGLPARGNDWNIEQHAAGNPNSALRGTTQIESDPMTGNGAAYWAGEGNCVVRIKNVPTWDVNKALAGRVRGADGTFRGNAVHGENEFAIPAEVPPAKIVKVGVVKSMPSGRLRVEWLE
jgi:hypothetical protein